MSLWSNPLMGTPFGTGISSSVDIRGISMAIFVPQLPPQWESTQRHWAVLSVVSLHLSGLADFPGTQFTPVPRWSASVRSSDRQCSFAALHIHPEDGPLRTSASHEREEADRCICSLESAVVTSCSRVEGRHDLIKGLSLPNSPRCPCRTDCVICRLQEIRIPHPPTSCTH